MKTAGKAARLVLAALILLLLLLNVWQLADRGLLKRELPGLFGYSCLAVLSGSMEPAVSTGDLIVIHRQEHYETGDIITFSDEGAYTTHRIVSAEDGEFYTKGDANSIADGYPVASSEIIGRVILVIPFAGRVILFLRTPGGITCILLVGLAAVFLPGRNRRNK